MSIPPSINLTDALHPLDRDYSHQAIIEVPEYNGMDTTTYLLGCSINPDKITLTQWYASQIGDTEAEGTTMECEESILKFTPGKVYEITLEWSVDKIDINHCFGEASYVIVTE